MAKKKYIVNPIKNTMKQDLRKGSFRNEKCFKCGAKMKKCKCGIADPKDKVAKIREEKKEELDKFKEDMVQERLEEFGEWMEDFTKGKKKASEEVGEK